MGWVFPHQLRANELARTFKQTCILQNDLQPKQLMTELVTFECKKRPARSLTAEGRAWIQNKGRWPWQEAPKWGMTPTDLRQLDEIAQGSWETLQGDAWIGRSWNGAPPDRTVALWGPSTCQGPRHRPKGEKVWGSRWRSLRTHWRWRSVRATNGKIYGSGQGV